MIWLYRILFVPALILAAPYYGLRMIRRGGYAKDFNHRWGGQKDLPAPAQDRRRIWIQAVSVGEIEAIGPLVERISQNPNLELVITTTTSTGYAILRQKYAPKCLYVGIFPIDFWLFSRRAWNKLKPNLCVLMEGELWPEHLHQAAERKVPVMLINARMSDKSFARYLKFGFLARRLLEKFSRIAVSSEFDMARFLELGAPRTSAFCSGNLKFDSSPSSTMGDAEKSALRKELGFAENSLVLLGSSTWPGEEEMLVEAMLKLRADGIDCRLLLVPRHAERREKIIPAIDKLPHCIRSRSNQASEGTLAYLADTTGELRMFTQIADIAFVGKSLPPNSGGQTPIDCAALGTPIIYGPNMTNFRRACETLERENAAVKVPDAASAQAEIRRLARNPQLRQTLAANAKNWHASNIGATKRTYDAMLEVLGLDA